jgi:hypothetical protein
MTHQQLDIKFRFQPMAKSPDGILLEYLKNHLNSASITQELVLKALRAYWLVDAYQHSGAKKAELKRLAQNTIFALEEHANYLRTVYGLARPVAYPPMVQMHSDQPNGESSRPETDEEEEESAPFALSKKVQVLDDGGL